MDFLEKDLEDIIWNASQTDIGREELKKRGLEIHGKMYRQVNLGDYGRCDLLTISIDDKNVCVHIYELKKDELSTSTLIQVLKYKRAILDILLGKLHNHQVSIKCTIIGRSTNACLERVLSAIEVDSLIYRYDVNGLFFDGGWKYIDSLFVGYTPLFSREDYKQMLLDYEYS